MYNKLGSLEYDLAKDRSNAVRHGISLADAARLDWAASVQFEDSRADYGELRIIALGLLDGRVHVCVYTMRDDSRRIISLRRANLREVAIYEATRQDSPPDAE